MSTPARLSRWWLSVFFVLSYTVAAFAAQFTPGDWYQALARAPWSPPNLAFPIVWTILYAMIAIAGWLIFSTQEKTLKVLWVAQLILNGAWTWIFFGQHWSGLALFEIITLVFLVGVLLRKCVGAGEKSAAWLLTPYLVWLLLATSLNAYIVAFN